MSAELTVTFAFSDLLMRGRISFLKNAGLLAVK